MVCESSVLSVVGVQMERAALAGRLSFAACSCDRKSVLIVWYI